MLRANEPFCNVISLKLEGIIVVIETLDMGVGAFHDPVIGL